MPVFHTSHGDIEVSNWGYQLQGLGGAALDPAALAALPFDLLVTDFSRDGSLANAFTANDVSAMKAGKVAASYLSIGEASDFRSFWNAAWTVDGTAAGALTASAPSWLGPTNPDWPESRKVRYWDPGWQTLIFNDAKTGWLDKIVAQGFDAAYLDIVDAYYFWSTEAAASQKTAGDPVSERDAAQRMIDFITALTAHARETNPDFFVILQNGAYILDALGGTDPARSAALLNAAGGIAVEDIYLRNGSAAENNGLFPDDAAISVLERDFAANGNAVLSVDYVNTIDKMGAYLEASLRDHFLPTVAPTRGLDRTLAPLRMPDEATDSADLVVGTSAADAIHAKGGSDIVFGFAGDDHLYGGPGADVLSGGAGFDLARYDDATSALTASLAAPGTNTGLAKGDTYFSVEGLAGGSGNDTLTGNAAANKIIGGPGRDVMIGLAGNDSYYTDRSNDVVREQPCAGIDTVLSSASFTLPANVEQLVLTGAGNINAIGSAGNDRLTGNAGENEFTGGGGRDILTGHAGADVFRYTALSDSAPQASRRDVIRDFLHGTDKIDLSAIDANALFAGHQDFDFIGTRAFTSGPGQLRYKLIDTSGSANDKTLIEADSNGDRVADFAIVLAHLVPLMAIDFVL